MIATDVDIIGDSAINGIMSSRPKKKKEYRRNLLRQLLAERCSRVDAMEAELAQTISERTAIYLDTNHWVNLRHCILKSSLAKPEYSKILSLLERLSEKERIICPVSYPIVEELMKQRDPITRRASAKLMDRLSQRTCLQFLFRLILREWRHNVWQVMVGHKENRKFPVWTKAGFWAGQQGQLTDVDFWLEKPVAIIDEWITRMWSIGFEEVQAADYQADSQELVARFLKGINDPAARAAAQVFFCKML